MEKKIEKSKKTQTEKDNKIKSKENKEKKNNYILAIFLIVIILIGIVTFFLFNQKMLVKNEIHSLERMVATDKADYEQIDKKLRKTVSFGKYKEVEISFKKYIQDVVTTTQSINNLTKKEDLSNVLSAKNLQEDGREFKKTQKYIKETKEELLKQLNALVELMDKKKIMSYVENKKLPKKYISFYEEVAVDKNENLLGMQKSLQKSLDYYANMFDTFDQAITFLKKTKSWKIENNKLVFGTSKDFENYNKIIKRLNIA